MSGRIRRRIRSTVVGYAALPLAALAIAAPAQAATVKIDDEDGFDPALAVVPVDSEVTWRNEGMANHQTRGEIWTSPVLAPGEEFSFRFRKVGSYLYSDPLHPELEGTIWVIERGGRIGRKRGSAEHRYRATVELAVRESLEYRHEGDPPCQVGSADREVEWKARLGAKYARVPSAEVLLGEGGRTRFKQYEERREAMLLQGSGGECDPGGSYRPDNCTRSYTGKRLSIDLGWTPKDNLMLAVNNGPDIGFGSNGNFLHVTDCLDSYLGSELDSPAAPTRLLFDRAVFDGFQITPSAGDVRRLRAGKRVLVQGGVGFRALTDDPFECCAEPGNPDSGVFLTSALFDVQAGVKVRLVPRD